MDQITVELNEMHSGSGVTLEAWLGVAINKQPLLLALGLEGQASLAVDGKHTVIQ